MDWMYAGPSSEVDRENYLTGRKVDKNFELFNKDFKEEQCKVDAIAVKREVNTPGPSVKSSLLDLDTVRKEDPLVKIKLQEEQIRRDILANPIKMKCLRKIVMKELRKKMKKMYKGRLNFQETAECAKFFQILEDIAAGRPNKARHAATDSNETGETGDVCKKTEQGAYGLSYVGESARRKKVNSEHDYKSVTPKSPRKTSVRHSPTKSTRNTSRKDNKAMLEEMKQNAKWRSEQRQQKLLRCARLEEAAEREEKSGKSGGAFVRSLVSRAVDSSSLESRIKSKRQTAQRHAGAMDEHFARR